MPFRLVIIESPYAPQLKQPCSREDYIACPCILLLVGDDVRQCERCDQYDAWNDEMAINIEYARAATRDSLTRGEAPYASHLLYTQDGVLDDTVPAERKLGMEAGFAYRDAVDVSVVYVDRGISKGMVQGIMDAQSKGRPVEFRSLEGWGLV